MEELKCCPFCGEEAELRSEIYYPAMRPVFVVICCGCLTRSPTLDNSEGAVKAWNRRTQNIGEKECCAHNEEQED